MQGFIAFIISMIFLMACITVALGVLKIIF
jgi:hypothetical protein